MDEALGDLAARRLIEAALGDVRIVVCRTCNGLGELRHALYLRCPDCHGSGETTERLESAHERE